MCSCPNHSGSDQSVSGDCLKTPTAAPQQLSGDATAQVYTNFILTECLVRVTVWKILLTFWSGLVRFRQQEYLVRFQN